MGFFYFLKKKKFYLHFTISILLTIFLIWIVLISLNIFTRHGEILIVPDFNGSTIEYIANENLQNEFRFVIIDSIFDPNKEKGTIVMQDPLPYSKVKKNRKIYLTIVAKLPETVSMPNLVDLSLRQSIVLLETVGLKINYLDYEPNFAQNAVLEQLYNGEIIEPNTLIEKGSIIDLKVGKGLNVTKFPVPFLIGKKQKKAIRTIHLAYFNVGKEYFLDGNDPLHLKIYKQEPSWDSEELLTQGDYINVWYRSDENFDFDELLESLKPDTLAVDTFIIETEDFEDFDD